MRLESDDQRGVVERAVARDLPRRPSHQRNDPDLLRLAIGRDIHRLHGERQPQAIGGDLRIADALQLQQAVDIERPLLGEGHRRGSQQQEKAAHIIEIVTRDDPDAAIMPTLQE